MLVGAEWSSLNVGVRLRQIRGASWDAPDTLTGSLRWGFGLCAGTSAPFGSERPAHFLGIQSASPWDRSGISSFWEFGSRVVSAELGKTNTKASGPIGTLRVSQTTDTRCSAWYARYTKLDASTIRINIFVPTGRNVPTESEFLLQMEREQWQTNVANHDTYEEFEEEIAVDENTYGDLDSVNLFSNVPNYTSEQLRGIEWVSVKALRLS